MPSLFDLTKVAELVENRRPARILVMDTNVLMNEPDPDKWIVTAGGPSLFVLSDSISQELEFIKQREGTKERAESRGKAIETIRSLANLVKHGPITQGIPVKSGWVIGVPSPRKSQLDPELDELEDVVKAFKRTDTKLLLLTRECHQMFASTPVTFITGESNLSVQVQMQGLPCHLCTSFPLEGLKEASALAKPVDWDHELAGIQARIIETSIVVEVTLTDYKSAPQPLGAKALIIAEGRGVMYDGKENRTFLWTIPFRPHNIISAPQSSEENTPDPPTVHLDFAAREDFDQNIFDGIADRLSDCRNINFEEGKPTLQNPESVMEMLLYLEYRFREGCSETSAIKTLRQETTGSQGLVRYWTDWILDLKDDEDEQTRCVEGFIEAVNECWKIGQTYKFSFVPAK